MSLVTRSPQAGTREAGEREGERKKGQTDRLRERESHGDASHEVAMKRKGGRSAAKVREEQVDRATDREEA